MSWIADQNAGRTYDAVAKLELFFMSGGSDGSRSLEIQGENYHLAFTASLIDDPITDSELAALHMPDAGVWRVYGNFLPEQQTVIAEALSVTKSGHGFSLRGEPYYVRFKRKGELYGHHRTDEGNLFTFIRGLFSRLGCHLRTVRFPPKSAVQSQTEFVHAA